MLCCWLLEKEIQFIGSQRILNITSNITFRIILDDLKPSKYPKTIAENIPNTYYTSRDIQDIY